MVGKFVNADDPEYLAIDAITPICHLFAYCINNPVNEVDPAGNVFGTIIKKIILGVVKGFFKQLCIDVIEWAFRKYGLGKKEDFKASYPEDYAVSILTSITNEFSFSNIIGTSISVICLLIKYLPQIFGGRMAQKDWGNLLLDVLTIIVTQFMQKSLKKLGAKRSQIRNKKRNAPQGNVYNGTIRRLGVKIRYKKYTIEIKVPIYQQIISSIINILC